MKTPQAVQDIAARLEAVGIEDARREARILLAGALGLDAAGLLLLTDVPQAAFEMQLARREKREPLAYILGRKEFWGMEFEVSAATLIPRPDSETLIEAATAALPERNQVTQVLDLGTGTGCLLLAALSEFRQAFGIGIDLSPQAAALAARNARRLDLADRCAFIAGNWANSVQQKFNLILSNPPYIALQDLPGLMPEVARFEPLTALAGGGDGLAAYRQIFDVLPRLLNESGIAVIELGAGQAGQVGALASKAGLKAEIGKDLANIARVLIIRA